MNEFMPEIEIVPTARIKAIAQQVGRFFLRPNEAPLYMSNHYRPAGAEEMLATTEVGYVGQQEPEL